METLSLNQTQSLNPAFTVLKLTFGIVPIVAGLDKFVNLLTNWEAYIHPSLAAMSPISGHTLMMIIGVIEIIAGLIVLIRPAIGGYIVAAWLTLISLSLLASGNFLDVAVRDLVMAVAAFALAQMAKIRA